MTALSLFQGGNVPAFARGEISDAAKAMAGGGGAGGKRISIRGGVFRLVDAGKEIAKIKERELDVVIVNAASKIARGFYAKVYDEDNPSAPDCWSGDGDAPDKSVAEPQSVRCADCPQNAKGSGQGDSRACRFNQRLAVVLANDTGGDVMQLSLASTSLFGKAENGNMPLQAYTRYLLAQSPPVDPVKLVTRLEFDTDAATPKIFFKPVRWLTEEEYENCAKAGKSPEALQAISSQVFQMDGLKDKPAPLDIPGTQVKADPDAAVKASKVIDKAAKAAPAPKEYQTEGEPEPTVRKEAAKPAAAKTGNLAKTLDEWDD